MKPLILESHLWLIAQYSTPEAMGMLCTVLNITPQTFEMDAFLKSRKSIDDLFASKDYDLAANRSYKYKNHNDFQKTWFLLDSDFRNEVINDLRDKIDIVIKKIISMGFIEIATAIKPILESELKCYPLTDASSQICRVSICKDCLSNDQCDIAYMIMTVIQLPTYLQVNILKDCYKVDFWNKIIAMDSADVIVKKYLESGCVVNKYYSDYNVYNLLNLLSSKCAFWNDLGINLECRLLTVM
jgi:hypothetical protein